MQLIGKWVSPLILLTIGVSAQAGVITLQQTGYTDSSQGFSDIAVQNFGTVLGYKLTLQFANTVYLVGGKGIYLYHLDDPSSVPGDGDSVSLYIGRGSGPGGDKRNFAADEGYVFSTAGIQQMTSIASTGFVSSTPEYLVYQGRPSDDINLLVGQLAQGTWRLMIGTNGGAPIGGVGSLPELASWTLELTVADTASSVPEPSTTALGALGLAGLGLFGRRLTRKSATR